VAFPDGKEKIVVMTRAHSMFMNCVPLTKQQLGADVLEKSTPLFEIHCLSQQNFIPNQIMLMPLSDFVCTIVISDCLVWKEILQGQKYGMPLETKSSSKQALSGNRLCCDGMQ